MGRPKKWCAEYARSYMRELAEKLGRPPERRDVSASARTMVPKSLGVHSWHAAQKVCGLKPTAKLPRRSRPVAVRPPSPLDGERAAFTQRQNARRMDALAHSVLSNSGKLHRDGTVMPGLWTVGEAEVEAAITRRLPALSVATQRDVLKAALRLQKEHAAMVRRIPVEDYLQERVA